MFCLSRIKRPALEKCALKNAFLRHLPRSRGLCRGVAEARAGGLRLGPKKNAFFSKHFFKACFLSSRETDTFSIALDASPTKAILKLLPW